jgi:hypothetical protein
VYVSWNDRLNKAQIFRNFLPERVGFQTIKFFLVIFYQIAPRIKQNDNNLKFLIIFQLSIK